MIVSNSTNQLLKDSKFDRLDWKFVLLLVLLLSFLVCTMILGMAWTKKRGKGSATELVEMSISWSWAPLPLEQSLRQGTHGPQVLHMVHMVQRSLCGRADRPRTGSGCRSASDPADVSPWKKLGLSEVVIVFRRHGRWRVFYAQVFRYRA